jgi:heptosyltransferase-2
LTDEKGKVLIRGVNWVGDAVMTMPAIASVRRAEPGRALSLLVKPWVAPLFEKDPHIDEIILYDDRYAGLMGKHRLARELRERGFSSALLLQNAFDAALLAYLAAIPERTGYNRDGRGFLLTRPIPYGGEDRRMHHIEYYLELLRRAGIEAACSAPWVYLDIEERLRAREKLEGLKRPVIGLNPGAAYGPAKEWPAERFAAVAGKVIGELDGSVVVFGKDLSEAARHISGASDDPNRLLCMAGKTSLRELSALVAECDALVTNDSGPMHIGYAVKCPLAAIFGSTDPCLTGPVGKGNIVLRNAAECSPCFERTCRKPRVKCMEEITAQEVFDAVRELAPRKRAVFFDRDGTLNEDAGYLSRWEDFKVFSDVNEVNLLKEQGYAIIGITNQSGVARGIIEEAFVREVNGLFVEQYGFDDFYYCTHHPDEHCSCRKPQPGMLLDARADYRLDLRGSYMVGDKESDMLAARAAGARGVLVLTGEDRASPSADFVARDLREAVRIILQEAGN